MGKEFGPMKPRAPLSSAAQGALWMVTAAFAFAILIGLIRYIAEEHATHPFQIAFFRNFFGLLFMLPWLFRAGVRVLHTQRISLHMIRSLVGLIAMLTWFTAITWMPLAEAVALSFTVPLFATAAAPFFLGESVGWRRWSATLVGFLGAMLLLQPGSAMLAPAAGLVLFSAAMMAVSVILIKTLSRTEAPTVTVTYMLIFLTPLSLVPALFVWKMPLLSELPALVALGVTATLAHLAMTRAFSATDVTAILPFDYLRLPFVAFIGFFAFGQEPDIWTWIGGGVIALAAIYIAERESRLRRTAITPASVAAVEGAGPTAIKPPPDTREEKNAKTD